MDDLPEQERQEVIHAALEQAMRDVGVLDHDAVLTGWCVSFELRAPDKPAAAGHLYGPATMTTWGALGLVEWSRRTMAEAADEADED